MADILADGTTTTDPRLDRIPQFDVKSRNHQIRQLLVGEPREPITRHWKPGPTLDQGQEGACVGFSTTHRIQGEPVAKEGLTNETARALYKRAQQLDEWPGEEPAYSGTSVLAGMKAAQEAGHIESYRWVGAGSGSLMEDIKETLSYVGGIVFGIAWMRSMFNPKPNGLMVVDTTKPAGGHAIHAFGIWIRAELEGEDGPMDLVIFQNSWGEDWGVEYEGVKGCCFIKVEDLEKLMEMQGEGAVPLEKDITPPVVEDTTVTPESVGTGFFRKVRTAIKEWL